jgi:hypothetical protein
MKNVYKSIRTSLLIALLFSVFSVDADVFHSTTAGGNWDNAATWDEAAIPTAADDVIITGPGAVIVYNNGYQCNDLTVNAGATLRNRNNEHRILTIAGDFTNNGTVNSSNYHFTLYISGDIVNNGVWTPYATYLNGNAKQYLTCGSGFEFAGVLFHDSDNGSAVEAVNDLVFGATSIYFNGSELILPAGGTSLTLHGSNIHNMVLTGNDNTLTMDANAALSSGDFHDLTLEGTCIIHENNSVYLYGEIINNGTLINRTNENRTLIVVGNLTNNGAIENSNYHFTMKCSGNLINNGTWINWEVIMNGATDQQMSCQNQKAFSMHYLNDLDNSSAITAASSIYFESTLINLGTGNINLPSAQNYDLSVIGGYLINGALNANGHELFMHSDAYVQDMVVEEATLKGIVRINSNGVVFNGNTIVEDTLQTRTNENSTITVNDLITNNGLIRNSNYQLYVNVYGDIVNNGDWINTTITMRGSSDQNISCLGGHSFGVINFNDSDNSSKIFSTDKVSFSGTNLDLSGGRLDCAGNELEFINNARINNTEIEDAVLTGTILINNNNVHFYGQTINNGTFQNPLNENISTHIYGDFTNNGTVTKPNYNLYIYFYGNVTNNGVWTFSDAHFSNNATQYITLAAGQEFACNNFIDDDPASPVEALTDLVFSGTQLNFNNGQLIMPVTKGGTITLHGGYLNKIDLITNSGILEMDGGALLWDHTVVHNATLEGTVIIREDPVTFKGETVNNGSLINSLNKNIYWCNIDGNIINNGTIDDPNYQFYLRCYGNITNNGTWSNHYTQMMSLNTHELYQGGTGVFSGLNFVAADTTGTITVMTDFDFSNTKINLNGVTMELDNSKGANLSVVNEYLYNGTLKANGQNLYMHSNGYLKDIIVENATLQGIVCVDEGVVLNGNTFVEDTLQTRQNENSTITANDLITNNGLIQNSNYQLYFNVNGDIVNNGLWINTSITMTGISDQYISCLNGNSFGVGAFYDSDNSSKTISAGNVSFSGTNLNLSSGRLDCEGYELEFINGAKINDSEIEEAVLVGTTYIDNNNVHFYGRTTNNGTFRNVLNENRTTYFHGDIYNNGTILNPNYSLYILCEGNIVNNGTWTNIRTTLNGNDDQFIYLINNQEITGQVYFDALSAGSPYQWYYESAVLDSPDFNGETSNSLIWLVPVSENWSGDFYCQTGAGQSRTITIQGGLIFDISVILEAAYNGTDMSTTLNDNGIIPLSQPYNVTPWNYNGTESVA